MIQPSAGFPLVSENNHTKYRQAGKMKTVKHECGSSDIEKSGDYPAPGLWCIWVSIMRKKQAANAMPTSFGKRCENLMPTLVRKRQMGYCMH
jgi:hypothetical protein